MRVEKNITGKKKLMEKLLNRKKKEEREAGEKGCLTNNLVDMKFQMDENQIVWLIVKYLWGLSWGLCTANENNVLSTDAQIVLHAKHITSMITSINRYQILFKKKQLNPRLNHKLTKHI